MSEIVSYIENDKINKSDIIKIFSHIKPNPYILYELGISTDTTIKINNKKYKLHYDIISSKSLFFKKFFNPKNNCSDNKIQFECNQQILEDLIKYLYDGNKNNVLKNKTNYYEYYRISDFFLIDIVDDIFCVFRDFFLEYICEYYLCKFNCVKCYVQECCDHIYYFDSNNKIYKYEYNGLMKNETYKCKENIAFEDESKNKEELTFEPSLEFYESIENSMSGYISDIEFYEKNKENNDVKKKFIYDEDKEKYKKKIIDLHYDSSDSEYDSDWQKGNGRERKKMKDYNFSSLGFDDKEISEHIVKNINIDFFEDKCFNYFIKHSKKMFDKIKSVKSYGRSDYDVSSGVTYDSFIHHINTIKLIKNIKMPLYKNNNIIVVDKSNNAYKYYCENYEKINVSDIDMFNGYVKIKNVVINIKDHYHIADFLYAYACIRCIFRKITNSNEYFFNINDVYSLIENKLEECVKDKIKMEILYDQNISLQKKRLKEEKEKLTKEIKLIEQNNISKYIIKKGITSKENIINNKKEKINNINKKLQIIVEQEVIESNNNENIDSCNDKSIKKKNVKKKKYKKSDSSDSD